MGLNYNNHELNQTGNVRHILSHINSVKMQGNNAIIQLNENMGDRSDYPNSNILTGTRKSKKQEIQEFLTGLRDVMGWTAISTFLANSYSMTAGGISAGKGMSFSAAGFAKLGLGIAAGAVATAGLLVAVTVGLAYLARKAWQRGHTLIAASLALSAMGTTTLAVGAIFGAAAALASPIGWTALAIGLVGLAVTGTYTMCKSMFTKVSPKNHTNYYARFNWEAASKYVNNDDQKDADALDGENVNIVDRYDGGADYNAAAEYQKDINTSDYVQVR